jgi:hypothetical protein
MRRTPTRREALATATACLLLPAALAAGAQEGSLQAQPGIDAPGAAPVSVPVPVAVLAVAFPIPGAADAQVPLLVEIGGPELLAGNAGTRVEGEIRAAATDAAGRTVQELTQPFALDTTDETLQRAGLKLYAVMRLGSGDYGLRVEVANSGTGALGVWDGGVHVPDFARGELALSPPMFPERPDRWRVFRQSDSPHEALVYPFQGVAGEAFLPAAAPKVGFGGAPFHVFLYGAESAPERFEARLLPAGPAGRGAAAAAQPVRVPLEVVGIAAGPTAGSRTLALRLGDALPPAGPYALEVVIAGRWGSGATRSAVTLVAEQLEVPEAVGIVRQEPPPAADEPAVPARDWTREALTARYRELLVRGAEEGFEAVARELAETELSATADHKAGQIKALREVQEVVLRRIVASGGDGLLPVIYAHYLADQELMRRGEIWMLAQNRHWIATLVRRWAGEDAAARRVAAQILATAGVSPVALEMDPHNELAMLRQAMGAEKSGHFDRAAEWIAQLVAAHPESRHARLRQAVVLRRLGSAQEAAARLAALVDDPAAPRWMTVLAYQELAEIHRQGGRRPAAEATLRRGIERLGAQELFLQLSFYLDDWQRPDESVSVLNRMPPQSADSSARHLYNAPPEAELAAARRELEAALPRGLPPLRAALGAPGGALAGSR